MQTVCINCLHCLVSGNIISDVSQKNGNARLESKDYIKYLGGFLDKHLSWKFHIDTIASKISKTVGLIAKLRHDIYTIYTFKYLSVVNLFLLNLRTCFLGPVSEDAS